LQLTEVAVFDAALESRLALLGEYLRDSGATARWREFLTLAADDELRRINAFEVAGRWRMDGRDALAEFIHATRAGLVTLNWDVVCQMCGFPNRHEHLGTVRNSQECRACGGRFDVALDGVVEVTFTVHEAVRRVADEGTGRATRPARRVTGLDCATLSVFREFFAAEVLSHKESLEVRDVSVMFTDIKGSTGLYNRLGDARAYAAVRRHFDILFEVVDGADGAIVKTIGDAVMASFTRPADAVRSALAAQSAFTGFRPLLPDAPDEIVVKIGIHRGPCIAVTLNERLDFFGGAVNVAARTEQQARGGETLITEATYSDPEVRDLLGAAGIEVSTVRASLRGFAEKFVLYRVDQRKVADGSGKNRFGFASLKNLLR
jgi:class 3 adenylate cyclase